MRKETTTCKNKSGMLINKYRVLKVTSILLLAALFYTYLQLALLSKEYSMYKEYNTPIPIAAGGVPNLPRIQDLK